MLLRVDLLFVLFQVTHSMRINDKPLDPWLLISEDGTVQSAHCTCMAGLSEGCSHIAAALFAMENGTRLTQEASVTDVPSYWIFPTPAKFASQFQKIREMNFQSASKKRKTIIDCTSTTNSSNTPPHTTATTNNNIPSPTKHEEDAFFAGLYKACLNAAVLSLHTNYSDNFIPKYVSYKAPKNVGQLYDPDIEIDNYDDVLMYCDNVDINVNDEDVKFVLHESKEQSKSALWLSMRAGRVTASMFYGACHIRIEKPALSLLRIICTPQAQCFKSAATSWGVANESKSRLEYATLKDAQHEHFSCQNCGLFCSTAYPMFAATPDGLVACNCCGLGLFEVKCPFTLQTKDMTELEWMVVNSTGKFRLSRTHTHYYQVQMQLYVTNRVYRDFAVCCTSRGLCLMLCGGTRNLSRQNYFIRNVQCPNCLLSISQGSPAWQNLTLFR